MNKNLLSVLIGLMFVGPRYVVEESAAAEGGVETLLDMDAVLNQAVDELPEAPEFVQPPDGTYVISVKEAKAEPYKVDKDGKEEKRVRLKIMYTVLETRELSDDSEPPVAPGSMFSEQFMTNENGFSYFKRQAKNILGEEVIKGATIGEILKALPSADPMLAKIKNKDSKPITKADGRKVTYTNTQVKITGKAELPAAV